MEVTIRPKNFKLTPNVETQIRRRIEKLPRFLENIREAEVVLSQQPTKVNAQGFDYVAQLTVHTANNLIRSEVVDAELLTAMDKVMSNLGRQIERYKGRHYRKHKGSPGLGRGTAHMAENGPLAIAPSIVEMAAPASLPDESGLLETQSRGVARSVTEDDDGVGGIVRVKRFSAKPMNPEEAVEQMELLGHNFFVFWNAEDERMSVIYRRNDGDYGLLEPELT